MYTKKDVNMENFVSDKQRQMRDSVARYINTETGQLLAITMQDYYILSTPIVPPKNSCGQFIVDCDTHSITRQISY